MNITENLVNKNNFNYMISTTNTEPREIQIETHKKAKLLDHLPNMTPGG